MNTLARIEHSKIVAVLRSDDASLLVDAAHALLEGGVNVLEVTFTVPRAIQVIEDLRSRLPDSCLVGAGTVLDDVTARLAILAGAEFVVSPHTDRTIIEMSRRYSIPVMAGAFTPTEILSAWNFGADVVKVFPAEFGGSRYLKAISGPLPQVKLMPTGGVDEKNAADFLRAGAVALGVGGSLVDKNALGNRDFEIIRTRAESFRKAVDNFDD